MKHKTYLLYTLALALLSPLLLAESFDHGAPGTDAHRGPASPEQGVLRMSEVIDMTSEQIVQLLEVFEATEADVGAIRDRTREQLMPEICVILSDARDQVAAILDENQLQELETFKSERMAMARKHPRRRHPEQDCAEANDSTS